MKLSMKNYKIFVVFNLFIIISICFIPNSALANADLINVRLDSLGYFESVDLVSENGFEIYDIKGKTFDFNKNTKKSNYNLDNMDKAVQAKSGGYVEILGRKYRGMIFLTKADNGFKLVNRLPMNEYLYGVLPNEMPASWELEALKSQAICARTFAKKKMFLNNNLNYDLVDSTSSQVYKGYSYENKNSNKAVDLTSGLYLKYKGEYIDAVYHSCSGGYTENSENIWNTSKPYLKGIEDVYSLNTPRTTWNISIEKEELESELNKSGYGVGRIKSIEVVEKSDFNRVMKLEINGTAGIQILEKEEIRKVLGYDRIPSIWYTITSDSPIYLLNSQDGKVIKTDSNDIFVIDKSNKINLEIKNMNIKSAYEVKEIKTSNNGKILINGNGYGHGVGLSQWGAKNMAQIGFTYEEILKFYYQNVDLISEE